LDGTKRASDAIYNMTAQLLAAILNFEAQAGQCSAATNAILDGLELLDDLDFTGIGPYAESTGKAKKNGAGSATPAQRTEALQLGEILDDYNNNVLCP
jgi:hypothetical protein